MSKVTSKLRLILPKALAAKCGIRHEADVRVEGAGEVTSMAPEAADRIPAGPDGEARLRLFDEAAARQEERQARRRTRGQSSRGWTRDELYERGRSQTG